MSITEIKPGDWIWWVVGMPGPDLDVAFITKIEGEDVHIQGSGYGGPPFEDVLKLDRKGSGWGKSERPESYGGSYYRLAPIREAFLKKEQAQ